MESSPSIEPNKLSDRYEVVKNLHGILSQVVESLDEVDSEGSHPISEYCRGVKDVYAELGSAQRNHNDFSIEDYRKEYGDILPTLDAESSFGSRELPVLVGMGIVNWSEKVPLPVDGSGKRLPIFVKSSEEVKSCLAELEKFRQHIPDRRSVKILHIADTHLGFSRRYEGKSGGRTPDNRVNCLGAFEEVSKIAKEKEVDAVVHAGDLFDHGVGKEHVRQFEEVVDGLDNLDIDFYIVVGNHDAQTTSHDGIDAVARLMNMQRKGQINLLSREPIILGDGIVALYGIGHVDLGIDDWSFHRDDWDYDRWDESWWDSPNLSFENGLPAAHSVLCAHGSFEYGGEHIPASNLVERANIEFDRLLLGDAHEPQDGVGGCDYAHYPGPTQALTPNKEDQSPRINVFEFYNDGDTDLEKVYLPT